MKTPARPLAAFLLTILVSLGIGLFLPLYPAIEMQLVLLGYPVVATCFGIFLFTLYRSGAFSIRRDGWKELRMPALAVLAASLFVLSIEPFMLKIVTDELLISSTGQMMHFERAAAVPQIGNWSSRHFNLSMAFLDKRPFFFPFLISLIHDLTGYRLENVFALNVLLTVGFFTAAFALVSKLAGRMAAYFFLVLLAFFPLMAQCATSGNTSVLNVFLITLGMLLALRYYEQPDEKTLPPLVFTLLLLAQTRYESAVLILPFGIWILAGWWKAKRTILPVPVILAPLFMVTPVLHQRYAMVLGKFYWQEGPGNRHDTFRLDYLPDNLRATWEYLFDISYAHSNSIILAVCGLSGLLVLLFAILRGKLEPDLRRNLLLVLGLFLTNFGVILFFNYGYFIEHATSRLAMPFHLFMGLFAALAFAKIPKDLIRVALPLFIFIIFIATLSYSKQEWIVNGLYILLTILFIFGAGAFLLRPGLRLHGPLAGTVLLASFLFMVPKLATKEYFHNYRSPFGFKRYLEFVREQDSQENLYLSDNPNTPILVLSNGTRPFLFLRKGDPAALVRQELYKKVFYIHYLKFLEEVPEPVPSLVGSREFRPFEANLYLRERIKPGLFMDVYELVLPREDLPEPAGARDNL